ncbi:MAG: hypothetical protein EXS03_03315 [Phycisphaerales bacterium]|nr:hypothetical protein [Phycisphaerales bacterium]
MRDDLRAKKKRPVHLDELWEAKRRVRTAAIDRMIEDASDRGDCTNRLYWTLLYDFDHAPMTTNLAQLEEAGVRLPALSELPDSEVGLWLWEAVEGLADLCIYLVHTNHLSDRALYQRLVEKILIEPVRDLPPDAGVNEFVDLVGGEGVDQCELHEFHDRQNCDRDRHLPRPRSVESDHDTKMEDGRLPLK